MNTGNTVGMMLAKIRKTRYDFQYVPDKVRVKRPDWALFFDIPSDPNHAVRHLQAGLTAGLLVPVWIHDEPAPRDDHHLRAARELYSTLCDRASGGTGVKPRRRPTPSDLAEYTHELMARAARASQLLFGEDD